MRRWVSCAAVVAVVAGVIVPGASASALSPYDSATQSDLHNLFSAMTNYYYYGPTGSFEGITEQRLVDQGYSKPANSKVQLWVEGSGDNFAATSEDIRGGQQYSVTASGYFEGNGAGTVGVSSPQPPTQALVASYLLADTNVALDEGLLAERLVAGKVTAEAVCDATLEYPGTHGAGSSVSDQTLACYAALQQGGSTVDSVLTALRTASGAAMLGFIANDFVGDGTTPATAPSWVGSGDPRPAKGKQTSQTADNLWRLPKTAEQISGDYAPAVKKMIMYECSQRVAQALAGDPVKACENTPIFASGQSDVKEATDHDIEALADTPNWVQLHYRAAADNPSYSGWQNTQPVCKEKTGDKQCDEYPFFASAEGGGQASTPPSLKVIAREDNEGQGSNYNAFLSACHLKSIQFDKDTQVFFAIPVPAAASTIPTMTMCNGR